MAVRLLLPIDMPTTNLSPGNLVDRQKYYTIYLNINNQFNVKDIARIKAVLEFWFEN